MVDLLVMLLRVATFGGGGGLAGHGLWLLTAITIVRYLRNAKRASRSR
jgi:hypothetical protein